MRGVAPGAASAVPCAAQRGPSLAPAAGVANLQRVLASLVWISGGAAAAAPAGAAAAPAASGPAAIVNGSDEGDDPAVVGLVDEEGAVFCTGTLVSAIDVLTAAHCVGDDGPLPGIRIDLPGAAVPVVLAAASARVHPDFDPETLAHDLAVVRLARPAGIQPLPIRAAPLPAAALGREVRIVGYGTDGSEAAPRKRTGRAAIDALDREKLRLVGAPALPCYGDSGGPVLASFDGAPEVIGVVSRGDAACADHAIAVLTDEETAPFLRAPQAVGGCAVGSPASASLLPALFALLWVAAISCRLRPSQRARRIAARGRIAGRRARHIACTAGREITNPHC